MVRERVQTGVLVGDLMTRNFIHITPIVNLREAAKTMIKKRVGSLIILEKDNLKGILTEKDIVWAAVKKGKSHLRDIHVKDLMKRKVVTIKPSVDIVEALAKMRKKKVRRLPVLENKKVIGMLTMNDILRIDPGLFQLIGENFKIKEETEKLKRGRVKMMNKPGVCQECGLYGVLFEEGELRVCERCVS